MVYVIYIEYVAASFAINIVDSFRRRASIHVDFAVFWFASTVAFYAQGLAIARSPCHGFVDCGFLCSGARHRAVALSRTRRRGFASFGGSPSRTRLVADSSSRIRLARGLDIVHLPSPTLSASTSIAPTMPHLIKAKCFSIKSIFLFNFCHTRYSGAAPCKLILQVVDYTFAASTSVRRIDYMIAALTPVRRINYMIVCQLRSAASNTRSPRRLWSAASTTQLPRRLRSTASTT
jgi:hypothetical protein